MLLNHCDAKPSDSSNENCSFNYSQTFANNLSDDEIYPLTVAEIAGAQRSDPSWKTFFRHKDPKGKFNKVIIDKN